MNISSFIIHFIQAKEMKKNILTEEILTLDDKIQYLEVTLKHEMKGIVKESDLSNIKDEILDKIMTRLEQIWMGYG